MKMRVFASSVSIDGETQVEPQDIIDALETLDLKEKLSIPLPAPGQGPDFFLGWAREELREADAASDENSKLRKYYNAAVYSKGAVECLIDWYIEKLLLNFTIPQFAGTAQKLEALNSEDLLGISFSLFNDIVFEPRNRGIHKFEFVEEKEAKHGYELARLTVKNCVHHVSPSDAAVFYGKIVAHKGDEAFEKLGRSYSGGEAFYFESIGQQGDHAVLLDRTTKEGRISILEATEGGKIQSRYCNVRGKFSSEQIRTIFSLLDRAKPKTIAALDEHELHHVLNTLLPEGRERLTGRSKRTTRKRAAG